MTTLTVWKFNTAEGAEETILLEMRHGTKLAKLWQRM